MDNTETLTVEKIHGDYNITVMHDQSGSSYGMTISPEAFDQLRRYFLNNQPK